MKARAGLQVLSDDGERVLCRGWRSEGNASARLAVLPAAEHPAPASLDRLAHEYGLREELDSDWAVRPLDLVRERDGTVLVLEDPGGQPLDRVLGAPMETGELLRLAIGIAAALGKAHHRGLVHKDVKPANILVNPDSGEVRLTGFGLASRLARERQRPEPPESIAGTLAYMAPEQTGRMNRSIDSRSDLYALGVTLYEMLTGSLPFTATDPMEWVHCHIARQPVPPGERSKGIPGPVSAIVMKLLAKTAEERYQTAAGLERDLRRCLAQWEADRRIDAFPPGQQDRPDRLLIPEKLYGREREIEKLLASFERVIKGGTPELVLVAGYSGIGKSSVVNELHKVLVEPRGLFASGKFDQYKRDIPYSTLAEAFQSLTRRLLAKSEADLATWRAALLEALGPNGRLMIDFVPELKHIIGNQPPVPDLPPQDARRRFQVVFRRFIGVFARPDHPLALFLDDLQWLDAATLDLLEDVLNPPGVQHLMLIGAYRDNEVTAAHPLMRKLEAIRNAGANVQEITLAPLAGEDVRQLIADALRCEPERAAPLAQLAHEKTAGNPFFLVQFLHTLAEEGWLAFDHEKGRWSWDLNRIHAKRYRDNIVDLMVGRLNRLPLDTQKALQQLACLGNIAPVRMLSFALGKSPEEVRADLWDAVRLELVEHLEGSYKFVHDRVQEAAYSLIPEELRDEAHLRIGRQLSAHIPPEQREEAIFDIVNQYNRGVALITSQDEREQMAELNLLAGKRAKASTAYASALKYLVAGAALLPGDSWERRHELIFALELHRAECEFLTGALGAAGERLNLLSARAANTVERATVACLRLNVYTTLDQSERAVQVCLDYLAHLGVEWLAHPTQEQALAEYQRIWSLLDGRNIEDLIELPLLSDPAILGTLGVLTEVVTPALFTDRNLLSLVICRMVNLSLEHGNSDGSCFAYVWLGMIAGPHFDNYEAGFQFGRLGYELVERRGLHRYQARTYMSFGNLVMPWTRHVRTGRDLVRRAFDAANKAGDLTFAAYSRNNLNTNVLASGDPLAEAQREAERGLDFAQNARFGLVIDIITAQLGLIRTLRGLTPTFGCFNDEQFDERRFESHLASQPDLALPECWYWIRKLQARVLAGDYRQAIEASVKAQRLLWTSPSFFETAEFEFYSGLARAALCDCPVHEQCRQDFEALTAHRRKLEAWAANCPENFENRAALVTAEVARIEGREVEAMRLYEQAVRSARANGFLHNEALANELAGRFYAARGFEQIAQLYLRNARHGYLRWGADGKVRQLDEMYPHLQEERERVPTASGTIGAPVEHLDLATVLKVSQAVSGEIVLEKLVETLLRTAIEHAGAQRGVLILPRGSELLIQAEAKIRGSSVTVCLRETPVSAAELPESVVRYAGRTQETVILDDASARNPFSTDEYVREQRPRSVLCLPLVKQGVLVALLYMENNLGPNFFAPGRIAVLKVLASQAAISLDNSRLYRELQKRGAEIRRLVDANIVGIFIWELEGQILEANDAFLRMVGYEREDLLSGRLRWTDLTPAEWLDRDLEQSVPQLKLTGSLQPFEKEYFRKDGSRVPVLLGAAAFDDECKRGVAFVVDLTERKQAEEALRRSEAFLAEGQKLSHAGSWSFKPDGTCDYWSRELYEILGFDPKNGIATISDYFTRVHPEDREIVEATIQRMIAAGEGCDLKKRIIRPDSVQRVIRCVGMPVRENGVVTRFVGTLMDITEQEELTQELRRREAYLAEAQKVSHTGSWAWSPVSNAILYWSEECYRISGYDPAQGLPSFESSFQRIHPEDQPVLAETIERAVREKAEFQIEYRQVLPDGTRRNVRILSHPVLDASGKLVEFIGTVMDVTEQKRAEEERRAHLWFLESMDQINRAMQRTSDVEGMMSGVLEETLAIFGSDRAWLVYPCDPDAATCRVVMEHTRPEYPGAFGLGEEFPVHTQAAELLRRVLDGPGASTDLSISPELRERFSIQSIIGIAIRPKGDRPYLFGLHQCSHVRAWTAAERRLFEEIARRLEDALTSVLAHRNLLAREEELRQSEAYLAEAQKLSRTGSWAWSPDQDIRYWSEECYRVLSFDPQDGLPRFEEFFQRIHPDDQPGFRELIQTAIREKTQWKADYRIVHPGGAVRDIHVVGHPVLSTSGQLVEFVGTVIDITERKRAEEELRRSEAYLAEAQRLSHTGSWAWSPGTDARYWSKECYRILGFDPRDGLPRTEEFIQRIHPDDQPAFRESANRARHTKLDEEVYYRIVHPGGAVRDIHSIGHPVFSPSGVLIEFTGTVVDITERKRAEESIRRSEAFLAEGQRLSHTGSFGWNVVTGERTWSEETYRILGYDPSVKPTLERLRDRVHPDDLQMLEEAHARASEGKQVDFECRLLMPDGSVKHLHAVAYGVQKDGKFVELVGTAMDITERKRAEAALQEARAELERVTRVTTMGELAASIAHEINQPLAGVVTSANAGLNWLAANPPNLSKTRETLERILRDGIRGGEVLARIRALLKRTPPAKTLVSVNQIVRDVLALTAGELRQHSIELSLELSHNLPGIRGDSIQLQQVLLNLIKNAIEAMAGIANGQRTLRIQSRPGELDGKRAVAVEVSDTGVGFSSTETTRLFEAFHTTKPQGMGMGLWISRSIIESHHGRLTASSNHGPGATFVMMLPTENQGRA